ncbi:MAG: metal-dependent hydrolase [Sphingorhabdus sp.]
MDATSNSNGSAVPKDARPVVAPRGFRRVGNPATVRHWVRGDPYATAFFNALSAVFPHGETFMIRSMIPWADRVPISLGSEVRAFIEQEAGHTREHVAMNRGLTGAGYDIEPLDRRIKAFVRVFEGTSDITKLTATMCIEHFTAIVAAETLKNQAHLAGADENLRELWLWHAIEEIEHKGVAFDVWQFATAKWHPTRRWLWRSFFMIAITLSFFVNRTLGQLELLRQDGIDFWTALRGVFRLGFAKDGIARNIAGSWLGFFRPNFHPWDIDDRLLIAQGEAELAIAAAKHSGYHAGVTPGERKEALRPAEVAEALPYAARN